MNTKRFSELVRSRRKQLQFTQEDISENLGLSQSHYARLENGHVLPSLETLFLLARTLKISASQLFWALDDTTEQKNNVVAVPPDFDDADIQQIKNFIVFMVYQKSLQDAPPTPGEFEEVLQRTAKTLPDLPKEPKPARRRSGAERSEEKLTN